ncbi:MAG: hypothetical protein U5K76_07885 [Woeseiaceae bacterium]|nr:hypothetical protein [Woeseiaceae bacterium]
MPTRVAIAGGPGLGQFREDGTLNSNCSVFNFNPLNLSPDAAATLGRHGTRDAIEVRTSSAEAYANFPATPRPT